MGSAKPMPSSTPTLCMMIDSSRIPNGNSTSVGVCIRGALLSTGITTGGKSKIDSYVLTKIYAENTNRRYGMYGNAVIPYDCRLI